ncbi:MAG: hypothetical protein GY874_04575 [Desulfobacteraceae bacterium]|nr:hypothetical protein [Desulfobacteraceae bacterium]
MKRIQIDIPDRNFVELEKLMAEYGIGTKKELFNISLNLLKWAIKEKSEHKRIIASVDEKKDTYKEVILPIAI